MTVSVNLSGYTTDATALSLARTVEISKILDDVFQSDAMKVIVQKEMNGPIGQISAVQLGETNMISISAADTSPEKAYQTLKLVCDNYPKLMDNVFSNVIIRVVENPFMPTAPYNAVSPMVAGVIVGVLAAVAMTFLIVVISYMRDTVKNISDVDLMKIIEDDWIKNSTVENIKKACKITDECFEYIIYKRRVCCSRNR